MGAMRFEAIIFDFDGVIVDSEWLANAVLADVLTEQGYARNGCKSKLQGVPPPAKKREMPPVGMAVNWAVRRRASSRTDELLLLRQT